MDAKSIGNTISKLRKQAGMTQAELATILRISDKTVSKWENGLGYPDIIMFPQLASLFNVSIDELMMGEKSGIAIVGSMITDIVKNIDVYPSPGMLAYLSDIQYSVGGCVPNMAIDLVKIDKSIPIRVAGKVGDDENGRFLRSQLQYWGIDTSGVRISPSTPTSFCDVMNLPNGERTFFHKKGANADFSPEDIDIKALNCSLMHVGYLLLLDRFDARDAVYGTVMARFLHDVQKAGIKTSIDVVSDSIADYHAVISPALKYCHYIIINETECCQIWNLPAFRVDGTVHKENVRQAMCRIRDCGVKEKIIVHSKTISFLLDVLTQEWVELPSLRIPPQDICGSVGAGDAFCAGVLYGIYHEFSNIQILEFASAAAACSLFSANSIDGMRSQREIYEMMNRYERLPNETTMEV